jgi:hypothetical protein
MQSFGMVTMMRYFNCQSIPDSSRPIPTPVCCADQCSDRKWIWPSLLRFGGSAVILQDSKLRLDYDVPAILQHAARRRDCCSHARTISQPSILWAMARVKVRAQSARKSHFSHMSFVLLNKAPIVCIRTSGAIYGRMWKFKYDQDIFAPRLGWPA